MIYEYLKNVKVYEHKEQKSYSVFSSWFNVEEKQELKIEEKWTAIYHNKHRKWLVTNDLHKCGMEDISENIELIGFADNIDAIMFVVWEHQVSIGIKDTILEQIKRMKNKEAKKKQANDSEWTGWKNDSIHGKDIQNLEYKVDWAKSIVLKGTSMINGKLVDIQLYDTNKEEKEE